MEIVLLILKIIGITLLILLGLILLSVLLVVFYPVSYRLSASYKETIAAKLKVHWLFCLISVTLDYGETGKKCILRILGIPLMDFLNPKPKKEKKKKAGKKKQKVKKASKSQPRFHEAEASKELQRSGQPVMDDSASEADKFYEEPSNIKASKPEQESRNAKTEGCFRETLPEKESPLKKFWNKIIHFPGKIKKMILSILQKIKSVYEKGINLKEKLEKWIEVLSRDRTKHAIGKAKHHIIGILKHVMPQKWNAYMEIGFDDPAATGKVMGYYWMFAGLWGEHFVCVPDFENKVFSGTINAKGRIQVFRFLYVAYKFMFDKDLVYLRKINKEINS